MTAPYGATRVDSIGLTATELVGPVPAFYLTDPQRWAFYDIADPSRTFRVGAAGTFVSNIGGMATSAGSQAVAGANAAAIQAALGAGGGPVNAVGLTFINTPLFLSDNARLSTTPGAVLKVTDGSQSSLVQTSPVAVSWSSVTVAWTAGSTATVTWAGHNRVIGDVIVLQGTLGTTVADWFDVYRVISVTDANTIVIQLPFTPTAAPTGAITAKAAVRNVSTDLDLDHNFTNNAGTGQNLGRMAAVFAMIADSSIIVRAKDVFKYVGLLCGALNVKLGAFGYPNTHSDTAKVYGPCRDCEVTVFGQAAEDCVTIQALEPSAFRAYMPSWGNIRNVTLKGNANQTSAGGAPCVIYSDDTFVTDGVVLEDLDMTTMAVANPALAIKPGTGYLATASKIGDITVRRGRMSTVSEACVLVTTKTRSLRIDGTRFKAPDADNLRVIKITDVLTSLVIENVNFAMGGWPVSGTGYLVEILGTCTEVIFRNCDFTGTTNLRVIDFGANSVSNLCRFENCRGDSIDVLCRVENTATTVPLVEIIGGRYTNVLTGANMRKTGTVVLRDAYLSGMSNGAVRGEIAGTNVTVYESGCTFAGTATPLTLLTTATADIFAPTLKMDAGITGVNKTAGVTFINTGAGRGTLVAGHTVLGNGTALIQVDTPANTF